MRLQRLCLVALALAALLSASARAEADDSATAVLGLETQDAPPKLADEVAELLRQNVSSHHDLRLVSGRDLVELKLVFSCADESHTCMAQAGKSLNADLLVYGSIKRSGEGYGVWLKLFDVKREKIQAWMAETVPKDKLAGAALKPTVNRWFAKLRGSSADVGILRISSSVSGAVVTLDGVPAGAITDKPLVLADVPAGKHEIELTKAGQGSAAQFVSIAAGQTLDVKLALRTSAEGALGSSRTPVVHVPEIDAEADRAAAGKGDRPASLYRKGFWVTLSGAAISAGAALKFGLDVKKANDDLDPYRRYPCPLGAGAGQCTADGMPTSPLTPADIQAQRSLLDKGNRAQKLQWLCIGVGSALGIASGYFLYRGYLANDGDRPDVDPTLAARGLRIFPTASASSGGVLAEFDF